MTYTMKIRNRTVVADTLATLSEIYCKIRDRSGLGASQFPNAMIHNDVGDSYRVSYNGRIWKIEETLAYTPEAEKCAS